MEDMVLFGGKTEEHVVFEKTEEHENMLLLKRQEDMRTDCF